MWTQYTIVDNHSKNTLRYCKWTFKLHIEIVLTMDKFWKPFFSTGNRTVFRKSDWFFFRKKILTDTFEHKNTIRHRPVRTQATCPTCENDRRKFDFFVIQQRSKQHVLNCFKYVVWAKTTTAPPSDRTHTKVLRKFRFCENAVLRALIFTSVR